MKQQIARLSPHQNGKVFAVLALASSVVFLVAFMLLAFASVPAEARPPLLFFVGVPILYLLIGYICVAIACALYNALYKYVGGIEFEARNVQA